MKAVIAIFFLSVCIIVAGQSPPEKQYDMESVMVTTTREVTSAAISRTLVDSASLASSANASFAELLAKHTHIFVKTYGQGSLATVSFRGTAASHTNVEWNGITVVNPMLGQVDFSQIPVWFVDRAEVYHGGSSLREGSGALGGTVNIGSLPRWDRKFYGTVVQGGGSFGQYQSFVSAGGGNSNVQARVRYMYERADNNFKYYNDRVLPNQYSHQNNADYRRHGGVADIYWNAPRANLFSAHIWYHYDDRNLPPLMSYQGQPKHEYQNEHQVRTAVKWIKYSDRVRSELTSGYTFDNMHYFLASPTYFGWNVNYDSRSRTHNYYNRYNFEYRFSGRTVLKANINVDHHKVSIRDTSRRSQAASIDRGYSARRTEAGASVALYHDFSRAVSAFVLLREDLTDGDFSPVMPSVGFEYRPLKDERLSAKINATRNYHPPTLNDLYWYPGGNPNLDPEKGYTVDASLAGQYENGNMSYGASVTGYFSWIDDWIMWRPGDYYFWSAENIRKVFSRGLEAYASVSHGGRRHSVSVSANYALTRTTNRNAVGEKDGSAGKQLIYIPVHKGNVMAGGTYCGFYATWVWSAVSRRYTTSSNEEFRNMLPSYGIHDMTIGKKLPFGKGVGLDAQFRINNVFSKRYQAMISRAMPERNYAFLIKVTF